LPEREYKALQDLFESTGGGEWLWENGQGVAWDFSDGGAWRPCAEQWQGITCTFDGEGVTHVSELALVDMNLTGSIPDSVGDLTWLERIVFDNNVLSGTIPSIMNKLTSLKVLSMNGNRLERNLPDLSELIDLIILDVGSNQLAGPSPPWLQHLSKLMYFDLSNNHITGPFSDNPVGSRERTCYLDLRHGRLPGPIPTYLRPFDDLNKKEVLSAADTDWLEKHYLDMTRVLLRFVYALQAPFIEVDRN